MSDDGDFGREALDVLRLLLQEALRDEERKVGITRAGLFNPAIEFVAQFLPDGEAVRPKNDTSAYRRIIRQLGADDYFVVPCREILAPGRDFLLILLLSHADYFSCLSVRLNAQ